MIIRYYSIRDARVGFMNLQAQQNDQVASRGFKNLLESPEKNVINTNPEDYSMYFIGELDESTGHFVAPQEPVFICNALTFGAAQRYVDQFSNPDYSK